MRFDHNSSTDRCLVGCALGDSIGLPFENLSRRRIDRFIRGRPLRHRFLLSCGMVSDDTDHSLMVFRSLSQNPDDPEAFECAFAFELKRWLLSFPPGIGFATLRSLAKLWLGFSPVNSGVFSAGNGPAMRSAIIGCLVADNSELRRRFVKRSTTITHTDPKAFVGALAIGEIAAKLASGEWRSRPDCRELIEVLESISEDAEWRAMVAEMNRVFQGEISVTQFVDGLDCKKGVSGYIYHTVPFAIICWYQHFECFQSAIEACIMQGGDTDTSAAICGSIAGIRCDAESIPEDWLEGLMLWPFSMNHITQGDGKVPGMISLWIRNLLSLAAIVVHVTRRMLPPYG